MERLKLKCQDALNALKTLREIIEKPFDVIVRDASIQRFEYTFEAVWKFVKEYLKEKEGILCNSPKSCFRELFSLGVLNEKEAVIALEMTDRRNETSHTYKEGVAQIIYENIKEFVTLMESILDRVKL